MTSPKTDNKREMLPCPFCRTEPHLEANGAVPGGRIVVTDCPRECPMSRGYVQITAWNDRIPDPRIAELEKLLRDILRDNDEAPDFGMCDCRDNDGEWDNSFERDAGTAKAAAYAQRINDGLFDLAKRAVGLALERQPVGDASAMREALAKWKCGSCGGSGFYKNKGFRGDEFVEEEVECTVCGGGGLNPTARAALDRALPLDAGDEGKGS